MQIGQIEFITALDRLQVLVQQRQALKAVSAQQIRLTLRQAQINYLQSLITLQQKEDAIQQTEQLVRARIGIELETLMSAWLKAYVSFSLAETELQRTQALVQEQISASQDLNQHQAVHSQAKNELAIIQHKFSLFGIGEKEKEVELNISENSYSSSVLQILPTHVEAAPQSKYISKEMISIKRLDSLHEINIDKFNKIFLKIDTQGYEEQALMGAEKILSKVEGIQMELSLQPLYKGQSTFTELYEKIKKLNFSLWDLRTGFKNIKTGQIYQVDGIFFKN